MTMSTVELWTYEELRFWVIMRTLSSLIYFRFLLKVRYSARMFLPLQQSQQSPQSPATHPRSPSQPRQWEWRSQVLLAQPCQSQPPPVCPPSSAESRPWTPLGPTLWTRSPNCWLLTKFWRRRPTATWRRTARTWRLSDSWSRTESSRRRQPWTTSWLWSYGVSWTKYRSVNISKHLGNSLQEFHWKYFFDRQTCKM